MRKTLSARTVLTFLHKHGGVTPAELALAFGWGKDGLDKIREILTDLRDQGKIEWEVMR